MLPALSAHPVRPCLRCQARRAATGKADERLLAPLEGDVGENQEVRIKEEHEDEEIERLKHLPDPGRPTGRQVEEHRKTHLPFRSWCKWCVLGRGRGLQHRRGDGSIIPIIGMDYFFITKGGLKIRKELDFLENADGEKALEEARKAGDIVKCLLVRCFKSKTMFAHVVQQKGVDEENVVADTVLSDIEWLGHTKLILKADGEPALQALVQRVLATARVELKDLEQASKEDPAAYDSQSNGGVETGIQVIRGLFRTMKLCTEERIKKHIPVDHPLLAWMLEHVCLLLNVSVVGQDGMTSWSRIRGRSFRQQLLGFGEKVLYRFPSKGPQHAPQGNMGPLGGEAVCIGYNKQSNTFIVHTDAGKVECRSVTRRPEDDRWDADALARVQRFPSASRSRQQAPRVRFADAEEVGGQDADPGRPSALRRLRINKSDLETYGYDAECPQCIHIGRYGQARAGGAHSQRCRTRLIEAMGQTEAGRARLAAYDERTTQIMAERIERADAQARPADVEADTGHRGFLERAPEEEGPSAAQRPAPRPPPAAARVQRHDAVHARETQGDAEWREVPGGEAAPVTPRGTPQGQEHADLEDPDAEQPDEDGVMEENEPTGSQDVEMDFVGSLQVADDLGKLEPSFNDHLCEILLSQMGSSGRSYRREAAKARRALVSEVYSPPRITELLKECRSRHVMPGYAFDLTTVDPDDNMPWDFSLEHKRKKARMLLREQKPYVVVGSPMCTAFCSWQALNESRSPKPAALARARAAAEVHMRFVAEVYQDQIDGNRYFIHEHPLRATSWKLACIEAIAAQPGVRRVHADQCQFGAEIKDGPHRGDPILKPTGFLTNSEMIAAALDRRCTGSSGKCSRPGGGAHQLCSGKHAKAAAVYPQELCRAVLRGVRDQLRVDNLLKDGCYGVQVPDDDAKVETMIKSPDRGFPGRYRDALTGQVLKDELVEAARAKELQFFYSKKVWLKIPKHVARARSGRPPISVRWVDVNKGDDLSPNHRSRLVARQIRALDSSGQNYFAPAPPLEALRTVLSMATTTVGDHKPVWDPHSPQRVQLSFVDITRAYFNAEMDPRDPPTFVQLPVEDKDSETMAAQLLRHMYGTRMAADGWQEEYSTFLVALGFRQGEACPNIFRHEKRGVVTSVHGDDFTTTGPADALDWFESAVKEKYEATIGPRVGPGPNDAKEGRVLNRIVRWCSDGIQYEADPRQVERLVAECGLDGAKPVVTPGVKPTFRELEDDAELPAHLVTAFRGSAARANYLAADRIDLQFACKEVCRWMARPTTHAWRALKRICRYLNGAGRLIYEFKRQTVSCIDIYTDTDWSGCPKTRKSTSGGCVMLGSHAVKHWSATQSSIALSSGEAEFAGVIRGAGQGLGYQALLKDLGVSLPVRVWTDSSAAIGICTRQGLGKLRHLDTHTLWIQQAVRTGRVDLRKVLGEQNPADLLTKHSISRQRLESLITLFGCEHLGGRAESAPQLRQGATTKVTMAQADSELNGEEVDAVQPESADEAGSQVETSPVMPHLVHSAANLDELYPKLQAPEEELQDSSQDDAHDPVLSKGMAIAEEIRQATLEQGRRRHSSSSCAMPSVSSSTGPGAATRTATTTRAPPVTKEFPTSEDSPVRQRVEPEHVAEEDARHRIQAAQTAGSTGFDWSWPGSPSKEE